MRGCGFSLPEVAIALAVVEAVYTNRLVRAGRTATAVTIDRWARIVFPIGLLVALVAAVARAYMASE